MYSTFARNKERKGGKGRKKSAIDSDQGGKREYRLAAAYSEQADADWGKEKRSGGLIIKRGEGNHTLLRSFLFEWKWDGGGEKRKKKRKRIMRENQHALEEEKGGGKEEKRTWRGRREVVAFRLALRSQRRRWKKRRRGIRKGQKRLQHRRGGKEKKKERERKRKRDGRKQREISRLPPPLIKKRKGGRFLEIEYGKRGRRKRGGASATSSLNFCQRFVKRKRV